MFGFGVGRFFFGIGNFADFIGLRWSLWILLFAILALLSTVRVG